ncbi:hypothetical protein RHA1_ro08230 (plasmid) [Rhodococcus jostii RHA1]|uniref:Uncharacterized protein n=1 Tax=Rhodococcus jostii (strain RHA1) TaxID=101510 RepID=Q0RZL1_RHOJR|nr:hypothetical protein RHA1_ro08230 [Rhodococcus jostii RHA1]
MSAVTAFSHRETAGEPTAPTATSATRGTAHQPARRRIPRCGRAHRGIAAAVRTGLANREDPERIEGRIRDAEAGSRGRYGSDRRLFPNPDSA